MLLLDRVTRESETRFVGVKNLTVNELFFQGHFPNRPIMPGVLQVETMKQLCELIVRKELDPTGMQDVYLKKLQKVKFRNPAEPGDRLFLDAEIIELVAPVSQIALPFSSIVCPPFFLKVIGVEISAVSLFALNLN
jgi:UDP-3-O-[3-hydroxymyristoyl] N-acetylglucosamine deacetylase/3-hydroxyacyl-[acyl-carrier-protein] dehydratase